MAEKLKDKSVMYSLFALFFSIVLFYTANGSTMNNPIIHQGNQFSEMVNDEPVQMIYDQKKYFIQGFDPYVSAKLTSDNRIQLNSEKSKETRSFRVIADLSKLSVGTHEVPLKIKDEKSGVTVKLVKKSIVVTIENKETKKLPVSVVESELDLQPNVKLSKIAVNPEEIEATTGDETMKEIFSVKVDVSEVKNIKKDMAFKAPIKAVNHKGEELPVVLNPSNVEVRLTMERESKDISLDVVTKGERSSIVESISYTISPKTITIEGERELIDKVDHVPLTVNISGIVRAQTIEVPVYFDSGITSSVQSVKVTIIPKLIEKSSDSKNESRQSSNSKNSDSSTVNSSEHPDTDSSNSKESESTKESKDESKHSA